MSSKKERVIAAAAGVATGVAIGGHPIGIAAGVLAADCIIRKMEKKAEKRK